MIKVFCVIYNSSISKAKKAVNVPGLYDRGHKEI